MTDRLTIIADDYGLGADHDAAMRSLLTEGAIDAVSVLAEFCTPQSAAALRSLPGVRIGLHLNLTLAPPGAPRRPSREILLLRALAGLGRAEAAQSLDAQWRRFLALFGRPPDFIDGHEHCHAFPGIRHAVIAHAARQNLPMRSLEPLFPPQGLKARILARLGAGLARAAARENVTQNWRFCGVLPLDQPEQAIAELEWQIMAARKQAITAPPGGIWMMTHPGSASDPIQVPGHPARMRALETELLYRLRSH